MSIHQRPFAVRTSRNSDMSAAKLLKGRGDGRAGLTGYAPRNKKYVSTWVDSLEPTLTLMEGSLAKDGKTYTETGERTGMDGQPQKMKSVFEFKDDDTIVFTRYKVAEGKDQQMRRITYKRQKK